MFDRLHKREYTESLNNDVRFKVTHIIMIKYRHADLLALVLENFIFYPDFI